MALFVRRHAQVEALILLREVAVPVGLGPLRQWLAGFRRPPGATAGAGGLPAVAGAVRDAQSLSVSFSLPPRDTDAATGLHRGERADVDVRTAAVLIGELAEELQVRPSAGDLWAKATQENIKCVNSRH